MIRRGQIVLEHLLLAGIAMIVFLILLVFIVNRFEANTDTLRHEAVQDMVFLLERLLTSMSMADPGASYTYAYPGSLYGIPLTLRFHDAGFTVESGVYATSRTIPLLQANLTVNGNATLIFTRNETAVSVRAG